MNERQKIRLGGAIFSLELREGKLVKLLLPERLPRAFGAAAYRELLRLLDMPFLWPQTSGFAAKAYRALHAVPFGATISYAGLAARAGAPKAARAAGNVCARNPLPIIIPCHRVVASHGLGGFSGGLEMKRRLLELERKR